MTDLSLTIAPKSDQLNADDLIGGPITVKITKVSANESSAEQPIAINFEGDNGKPYMPCKSMRRVLVQVWGRDGATYTGRSLTLYRDPKVLFGGLAVGGIRISHMSNIDADVTMALTATRASRKPFIVRPLVEAHKKQTVGQWLDGFEAEIGAAPTDQIETILARDDVKKAAGFFRNGLLERYNRVITAAKERVAAATGDGEEDIFEPSAGTSADPRPGDPIIAEFAELKTLNDILAQEKNPAVRAQANKLPPDEQKRVAAAIDAMKDTMRGAA